jgi:hypothetical protein
MSSQIKTTLIKLAGEKNYENLSALKRQIQGIASVPHSVSRRQTLKDIGNRYHTDKTDSNHMFNGISYLDIYEGYFNNIRKNNVSILEIGVKGGASLQTWKAYFPHARIFGLDIDPECRNLEEPGIQIAIGSQDDVDFLKTCYGADQKFDIIIDDGSHINRHITTSFEYLFYNRLNPGGIYIIEDLRCSYQSLQSDHNILERWPGMKYNDPNQNYDNHREDMNTFFFDKIKELDYGKGSILSVHFWSMVCVITKTKNP